MPKKFVTPELKSADGKKHKMVFSTTDTRQWNQVVKGNVIPVTHYRLAISCGFCLWNLAYTSHYKTEIPTPSQVKRFNDHIDHYNLMLKLERPPGPTWLGNWKTTRSEGSLFCYRIDSRLPRGLKWWSGTDIEPALLTPTFGTVSSFGRTNWQSPWGAINPWLVIESTSTNKNSSAQYKTLAIAPTPEKALFYSRNYLAKRAMRGNQVGYPEGEWPEGVEAPVPPVEAFVETLVKIANTEDYGEILHALKEVNRGIIQLELLHEVKAQLEAKLEI